MSLVGFGVKNLRCLTDTGIVPLKPLTLLVGKNSSGKSTFLRAFPLLRQSAEIARKSPILWYHPEYVDFGTLDLAINDQATERSVTFEFACEWEDIFFGNVKLRLEVAPSGPGPYIRSYDLGMDEEKVHLELDAEHRVLRIAGEPYQSLPQQDLRLGGVAYLVPSFPERAGERVSYQPFVGGLWGGLGHARLSWLGSDEDGGVARIGRALSYMDTDIAQFMYHVAYLGPRRSVAERAHRLSEVAVEEVDPDGKNLSQFLVSLSPEEMASLADFTRKYLGFESSVLVQGLQAEILLKERGTEHFRSIADVGFGYAEILPLCAALWSSCVRAPSPKRRQTSLLALEQPELHLHPAHQARLGRMLVGALLESRKAGREVKLMVETHSDALITELARLIGKKRISHEDAQILFFDQDEETRQTSVIRTGYEADGTLRENWPFGFLWATPDEDEDPIGVAAEA